MHSNLTVVTGCMLTSVVDGETLPFPAVVFSILDELHQLVLVDFIEVLNGIGRMAQELRGAVDLIIPDRVWKGRQLIQIFFEVTCILPKVNAAFLKSIEHDICALFLALGRIVGNDAVPELRI